MFWRAGNTPGDRLTSWVYSTTFVQCLFRTCYLSENKPVLSYLLLRLLPQWWSRSGCTLCIVHCTLYFAFIVDSVFKFFSINFIGYNFHSTAILLKNRQLFLNLVFLLEVSRELPQRSILNTLPITRIFSLLFCAVTSPWLPDTPAHIFSIRLF